MLSYQNFLETLPNISPISDVDASYLTSLDIQKVTGCELDKVIIDIISRTFEYPHTKAGQHRLNAWNNGWRENLDNYIQSGVESALIPHYYKYPYIRIGGDLYHSIPGVTENDSVRMLMHYIYERFLVNTSSIVEIGYSLEDYSL